MKTVRINGNTYQYDVYTRTIALKNGRFTPSDTLSPRTQRDLKNQLKYVHYYSPFSFN